MRCDVNISVRPKGRGRLGTKVEIKNMNSFSAMQKAIEFEMDRQVRQGSRLSVGARHGTAWLLHLLTTSPNSPDRCWRQRLCRCLRLKYQQGYAGCSLMMDCIAAVEPGSITAGAHLVSWQPS
jgi:hypothetical protein